jgi:phage-related holin
MPTFIDIFLSVVRDNQAAQIAIVAVLVLILADWVFGIANAAMQHKFKSAAMRQGLGHKCAELGLLLVGWIADGALLGGMDLGFNGPIFMTVAAYICIMEIASLLEIFAEMNPELADSGPFKMLASAADHRREQASATEYREEQA